MIMFTDRTARSSVCSHECAYGIMVMGPEIGKARVPLCTEDRAKIFSGNAKPLLQM